MSGAPGKSLPVFYLEDIWKRFDSGEVLRGVNLAVQPGECAVILGASGSGKSVLTKILLGFLTPDRGRARVFGELPPFSPYRRVPPQSGRLGVVFQNDALFEDLTVAQNLALAIRSDPRDPAPSQETVLRRSAQLIRGVGLDWETVAAQRPSQLSGGMRKRVALARALAPQPEALLIDEPTAGLDICSSRRIVELLKQTLANVRVTAVLITHDLDCARQLASRLYSLNAAAGQLEEMDARAEAGQIALRLETNLVSLETKPLRKDPPGVAPGSLPQRAARFLEAVGAAAASWRRAISFPPLPEFLRRFRQMAVDSMPLAGIVFLMMGMILYVQIRMALAPWGLVVQLPPALVDAGLKLTPAFLGMIMAGRVGSAVCAEMGILRQTEQLEAMRVLGLAPERQLLSPWLWAAAAATPLLTLFSEAVAGLGAIAMLSWPGMGAPITPRFFWHASIEALSMTQQVAGLAKAALFGVAIVLAAYGFGGREQRGAAAVGRSITKTMVASFILIVGIDFVVSLLISTD